MLNIEKFRNELSKGKEPLDCQIRALRKNDKCYGKDCAKCRAESIEWLCSEYQILDDAEKRYLRGVIRPFRNEVKYMFKSSSNEEFISIVLEDKERREYFNFPYFKKGTMYKGMEANKVYTLEELGL